MEFFFYNILQFLSQSSVLPCVSFSSSSSFSRVKLDLLTFDFVERVVWGFVKLG